MFLLDTFVEAPFEHFPRDFSALQVSFEQINNALQEIPAKFFRTTLKEMTIEHAGKWLDHLESWAILCVR